MLLLVGGVAHDDERLVVLWSPSCLSGFTLALRHGMLADSATVLTFGFLRKTTRSSLA
jgi:hypothetical protein